MIVKEEQYKNILLLLILNFVMLIAHMYNSDADILYFCQLTIIGQILVILNFYFSLTFHEKKSSLKVQLLLSRFHLITLSLQFIVVLGFWSLRVFFTKGIINQEQERDYITQALSFWVHGGSFITMIYFIKTNQVLTETSRRKKVVFHLFWAIPFAFIQYLRFYFTGEHIYGFIQYFNWTQLIVFQVSLFFIAVGCDYFISIKHGYMIMQDIQHFKINEEKHNFPKKHQI